MGVESPKTPTARTARANVPVTEVKGGKTSSPMGSMGEGKQAEASMGMSSPSPGPGGGTVKTEGRVK